MNQRILDDKKIAFIICTNDTLYYDECVWYIEQLIIPEGYEIDIIAIQGAESMAEGYNAAMDSSDAKYKVYLHQDVFIYNKNFLFDIIEVFTGDEELGLLGVIGGVDLPQNAIIYNAWNRGRTYASNCKAAIHIEKYMDKEANYTEVEAIDGMIMITQYDLPWREDLDLKWDFYDISQSLEFRRKGLKVGIPNQSEPWCMHYMGLCNLINYDISREKVLAEYTDYFTDTFKSEIDTSVILMEKQIFQKIWDCITKGELKQAVQIKQLLDFAKLTNNELMYTWFMLDIYERDNLKKDEVGCFFYNINTWEEAREKFVSIVFMFQHLENGTNPESVQDLKELISLGVITYFAACLIAIHFTVDYEMTLKKICEDI